MKRILSLLLTLAMVSACNNSSTTTGEPTPSPGPVENVNGNVPDTSNQVGAPGSGLVDSSHVKDSVSK